LPGDRADLHAAARDAVTGPWRVAVTEGSMVPTIESGDWLLVNPRVQTWPRPGAVVVFREPISDALAVKRVAAGPGEQVAFGGGYLTLGPDEAWLIADAGPAETAAAGFGPPIDSNRFGPVGVDRLVGRVLLRYGPLRRFGRIAASPESGQGAYPRRR
jgi:signal peptidase I